MYSYFLSHLGCVTSRQAYMNLYLQMMVPDDAFLAFVQSGQSLGSMDDEDICMLTANRCS
jgi:hypothetical protein